MNEALRLLETEHQELQAKIEHLQGDRDLCSSDTQHLQGTLLLEASGSEPRESKLGGEKGFSHSFV